MEMIEEEYKSLANKITTLLTEEGLNIQDAHVFIALYFVSVSITMKMELPEFNQFLDMMQKIYLNASSETHADGT